MVSKSSNINGEAVSKSSCPPFYMEEPTELYRSLNEVSDIFKDRDDRIAVILGSGSSLEGFDFSCLDNSLFSVTAINDECFRNRDDFVPDVWMFFDDTVMMRFGKHHIDDRITICSRKQIVQEGVLRAKYIKRPIAEWLHRVVTFDATKHWRLDRDLLFMNRTTATPALCLAVRRGFRKIILLGIDFYSNDNIYYYTGQKPLDKPQRSKHYIADNIYMEDRHVRMLHDMTHVAKVLRESEWDGEIIQTSMHSPLSCWQKKTWAQAINHFKNS